MKGDITGWKALFIRHVDMTHGSPEVKEQNSTKYDLDLIICITAVPSNIKALLVSYMRLLDLLRDP